MKLTREYPREKQMPRISRLLGIRNVPKTELVQARVSSNLGTGGSEREKNEPGYKPDRQHDADHHAQETDEKVAVQSVDVLDLAIVRIVDRNEPPQEVGRQWLLSLPA
jgi:hypothetical protein